MIRLGKDKVDERFNILNDGTIVDLDGNIKNCYLKNGRLYFRSVKVHMIQIWTNFGYRDTKKWAIHHLDENPLNNSLDNLIFMTRSEHMRLHKNHSGHHHSEESKAKMSIAHKGYLVSAETKSKMSIAHKGKNNWSKGRIIVNNGSINKSVFPDQIPEGFVKGKLIKLK